MGRDVREWTNKVCAAMDEGLLDPKAVAEMCMSYMSEWDVEDMCRINDLREFLDPEEEEDEEDEEDDVHFGEEERWDVDESTEWADFDPDC